MLGASGVGKTALTAQFMTSEYLNTYEASLGNLAPFILSAIYTFHETTLFCFLMNRRRFVRPFRLGATGRRRVAIDFHRPPARGDIGKRLV